jgi:hypothetical protein
MDIDNKIMRAEELIRKRREIDEQLSALFSGDSQQKKQRVCSNSTPKHCAGKPGVSDPRSVASRRSGGPA